MADRVELLEATLDLLEEGIAVLDGRGHVVLWNHAAEELTGYNRALLLSRPLPADLYQVNEEHVQLADAAVAAQARGAEAGGGFGGAVVGYSGAGIGTAAQGEFLDRSTPVTMRHNLGHELPAMLRKVLLRDEMRARMGAALLFHPMEEVDALPHGESSEGVGVERGQAELEDRLDEACHQWQTSHMPFGVLWITVDQAATLRRTHGREACEAMLATVGHALMRGLRPTEVMGRWGDDEFLVVSHERTSEMLADHAQRLTGVARTADFRWWGDRVTLTVSIGGAQAVEDEPLRELLARAQQAMQASIHSGGNHVTQSRR